MKNDIKIWTIGRIDYLDEVNIILKILKKLKEYKDTKKLFFSELQEGIMSDRIKEINIDEIAYKFSKDNVNCIITRNKRLIENKMLAKEYLYKKNVAFCLVDNTNVKFYISKLIINGNVDCLDKENKKVNKKYILEEI